MNTCWEFMRQACSRPSTCEQEKPGLVLAISWQNGMVKSSRGCRLSSLQQEGLSVSRSGDVSGPHPGPRLLICSLCPPLHRVGASLPLLHLQVMSFCSTRDARVWWPSQMWPSTSRRRSGHVWTPGRGTCTGMWCWRTTVTWSHLVSSLPQTTQTLCPHHQLPPRWASGPPFKSLIEFLSSCSQGTFWSLSSWKWASRVHLYLITHKQSSYAVWPSCNYFSSLMTKGLIRVI